MPIGFLRYNALQASWDKRLTHGVNLLVSYTYSKSTQATSVLNMGDGVYQELTPTHRPHNLRLSGGWNLPELTATARCCIPPAGRVADQRRHDDS